MQPLYVVNKKGETVPLDGEWLADIFHPWLTAFAVIGVVSELLLAAIAYLLGRLLGAL